MNGWMGKVLRVDLTRKSVSLEDLDPRVAEAYVGGRGLGIRYLLDEVDPTCDPLGRENKLIMATGPLTGTRAPTGARYMVTTTLGRATLISSDISRKAAKSQRGWFFNHFVFPTFPPDEIAEPFFLYSWRLRKRS